VVLRDQVVAVGVELLRGDGAAAELLVLFEDLRDEARQRGDGRTPRTRG
jgi:hypothetical protein